MPKSNKSKSSTDGSKPKLKMEDLQEQIDQLTEALLRERADSANIRRRHDEQIGSLKELVKVNVVRDLLPVIDNCERLLHHINTDSGAKPWKQGVEQIVRQMQKALADMGVERIKTVGEVFDPTFHEAVAMEDGDGTVEVVSEELQSGYILEDHVIRHAMVRVRRESEQEQGAESKEQGEENG